MQHSPQEIKTRLGEAVDPEGNVLNMAAVVEVIGLLERTPLTKEALEQTRIGRTVNLLRKKTENEDIAKRAKKLVKRWQKLVQNHLEAVRNTNSPLNGLRCNSPVVNGLTKEPETRVTESSTTKGKQPDRIAKGIKRKRSTSNTPPPGGGSLGETSKNKTAEENESKESVGVLCQSSKDGLASKNNTNGNSVVVTENEQTDLSKRLKPHDNNDSKSICDSEQDTSILTDRMITEHTSTIPTSLCKEKSNTLDHNDVRWETKDFSQQTDNLDELEPCESQHDLNNLSLPIDEEVDGVNGHFGEDGKWYDWSQTMSLNEGKLIVLPYVLME